jgi:uncharacterized membrane protein
VGLHRGKGDVDTSSTRTRWRCSKFLRRVGWAGIVHSKLWQVLLHSVAFELGLITKQVPVTERGKAIVSLAVSLHTHIVDAALSLSLLSFSLLSSFLWLSCMCKHQ